MNPFPSRVLGLVIQALAFPLMAVAGAVLVAGVALVIAGAMVLDVISGLSEWAFRRLKQGRAEHGR